MPVPTLERDFAEFVSSHDALLRRILSTKHLRDQPDDVDDALQIMLTRAWAGFASWPTDPEERLKRANRLLRQAAVKVMRRKYGEHYQRKGLEELIDYSAVDGRGEDRDALVAEVQAQLVCMNEQLDEEGADDPDFERRWAAFNAVLPALKPIERDVLFAHHPANGSRKSTEVACMLGIPHARVRKTYSEARMIMRPLIIHALAPDLDPDEAARVLDYTSGAMTERNERGRMKRHLEHCDACRALAENERVIMVAGARVFLPLPAIAGLAAKASGATAAAGAGTAAAAAVSGGGGAAGAISGSGVFSALAAKAVTGLAAVTVAAGGYVAIEKPTKPHRPHREQVAAARQAKATAEPHDAAPAPVVTIDPTPAGTDTGASDQPETTSTPQATATPAATTPPQPRTPTTIPTAAPARSTSAQVGSDPPADKPSDSFSQEFGP